MRESNKNKLYVRINTQEEFDQFLDEMNVPYVESFVGKVKALIVRILHKREYVELQIHTSIAKQSPSYIEKSLAFKYCKRQKIQYQADVIKTVTSDHVIIRAGFYLPPKCFIQKLILGLQYAMYLDIPRDQFPESYAMQPYVLANRLKRKGCPVKIAPFPAFMRVTRRLPLEKSKAQKQAPFIW